MLLHNGNKFVSVPAGHSIYWKETYQNLELVINKLAYLQHRWMICGDRYNKYPSFLCEWDNREGKQNYFKKDWPVR